MPYYKPCKMSDITLEQLLEARFQQLSSEREQTIAVPPVVKEEVFRTLDLIDTLGEIGDLFTGKFLGATADFIDLIENTDEN